MGLKQASCGQPWCTSVLLGEAAITRSQASLLPFDYIRCKQLARLWLCLSHHWLPCGMCRLCCSEWPQNTLVLTALWSSNAHFLLQSYQDSWIRSSCFLFWFKSQSKTRYVLQVLCATLFPLWNTACLDGQWCENMKMSWESVPHWCPGEVMP